MYLNLDHHSGEPIYRQIVEQIKYKVASAELNGEDQLPSIRALARQLKINPRTVVKAYDELRHAGLVVMKHGRGVFVTTKREVVRAHIRRKAITDLARRLLSEASRMGAHKDEVIAIMTQEAEKTESEE